MLPSCTSYSRLIKSILVLLSSALVTASEFTGKSMLPDMKKEKALVTFLNSDEKLTTCFEFLEKLVKVG